MMTGFGMGFGAIGILVMLLFWGGLIALGVWLVKAVVSTGQGGRSAPERHVLTAREILDQRYARGEIGPEQYERMKQDLL